MSATAGPTNSSHPFTCNTCQVAFKGNDLQRGHMQSDWHRYNLKRRVASLPPLTSEVFTEKVLANQASAAATAAKASFEKVCAACQRTYFSENAYQNHLGSQKHKAKVAQLGSIQGAITEDETNSMMSSTFSLHDTLDSSSEADRDPIAEAEFSQVVNGIKNATLEDSDPLNRRPTRPHHSADPEREAHPLSPSKLANTILPVQSNGVSDHALEKCLFCNFLAPSIDLNVAHMETMHSLFIPERTYLVDMEGLIDHLHTRVFEMHECLYCGQVRHTTSGVQTHMRDKGHCMIAFDSEVDMYEVGQFYDFRDTYSDSEEDEDEDMDDAEQSNGVKLGGQRKARYTNDADEDMDDDDEGWESDSDATEDGGVGASRKRRDPAASNNVAYDDGIELHLPSGRTAGHRSLARYYRQNLRDYPSAAERERMSQQAIEDGSADDQADRGRRSQAITRANGGQGLLSAPEGKRAEAARIEQRETKRAQRQENRYKAGNERRANFQKHFRDPLLQ